MNKEVYFLGLDIGTDSVGWAVTDTEYHILKSHGKALWGARLFDTANTAEERRMHRTARRRIERQHQRIGWLQEVFAEEIGKVDPAFFQRLRESKFREKDKQGDHPLGRYTLFSDHSFNDKNYYTQYPTIYHLRKALLESDEPFDVRLVYLAIHHIMKNRGHFLFGDVSLDTISFHNGLERLQDAFRHEWETELKISEENAVKNILLDGKRRKTDKEKALIEQFGAEKKTPEAVLAKLLAGAKIVLKDLYGENISSDEIASFSLEEDFEAAEDKLTAALGDRIELILAAKAVYDWALLENIRGGETYLSQAKVVLYEKHEEDLHRLKKLFKNNGNQQLYAEVFHKAAKNVNNYPAYSGKGAANYRCDYEEFAKYLKSKLKNVKGSDEEIGRITAELEAGTFLPKQTSKNNGVIPHQLHEVELVKILQNTEKYLPFLKEKDESGLTKSEQIHKMFCFRVPYYVGPLSTKSEFGWIVRKEDKIYPWNFSKVVDLEACKQNFIRHMTAKCSYIGEDVLPKDSLLYSRFMVLNELNNLKINGHSVPVELKQELYQNLFMTGGKVTGAKLKNYLLASGKLTKDDELSGFDNDFKATLAPWKHFAWMLEKPSGEAMAEDVILHGTLFGEDRRLLAEWISRANM